MRKLEDLKVWKESINFGLEIYKITKPFPKEELFGLVSQMRRCSISISSNIAEGAGRNSNKEMIRFLDIANGSAFELETQLLYAKELEYISMEQFQLLKEKLHHIQKMIFRFSDYIKKSQPSDQIPQTS